MDQIEERAICSPGLEHLTFSWLGGSVLNRFQNQRDCSCCWILTAVSAIEAIYKINNETEDLPWLSSKNILDCFKENYKDLISLPDNLDDRRGGFALNTQAAFIFVKDFGILEEKHYPFVPRREECTADEIEERRMRINGFETLDRNNPNLVNLTIHRHPIVGVIELLEEDPDFVDLGENIFRGYPQDGVIRGWHAMLIIGYGFDEDVENRQLHHYFLVKGTHNPNWGINGFGKIARELFEDLEYPTEPYWVNSSSS